VEQQNRFIALRLVEGDVQCAAGFEIPGAFSLLAVPDLGREDLRTAVARFAQMFSSRGVGRDEVELLAESVVGSIIDPHRPSRAMQAVNLEHEGDANDLAPAFRFTPSREALASSAFVTLIVDTARYRNGAARVQRALVALERWLVTVPWPIENPPAASQSVPALSESALRLGALEAGMRFLSEKTVDLEARASALDQKHVVLEAKADETAARLEAPIIKGAEPARLEG
jgi:hypothetical protein